MDECLHDDPLWRPIASAPRDGGTFVAISNTEMVLVERDLERKSGGDWRIWNMPGRGERISDTLWGFHSWCYVSDLHRESNQRRNPEYYMTGAQIAASRMSRLGK